MVRSLTLEDHLEDLLGRELATQAIEGEPGSRRRVRLSPEVQPWCVLDPDLFEDSAVEGYRPRVNVLVEHIDPKQRPHVTVPAPASPATSAVGSSSRASSAARAADQDAPPVLSGGPAAGAAQEQTAATAMLRVGLQDLGIDPGLIDTLTDLAQACATVATPEEAPSLVARGQALLDSVETLTAVAGRLDAVLLSATKQLTGVNGGLLLADKSATTPEDLTASQREKWRAQAKRVTRHELTALTGWGPGETSDLVAIANLPAAVTAPLTHSLTTGESTWRLVRRYHRACSTFTTEDAAAIAHAMFGPDPTTSVTERLDSAGQFLGGPWRHPEFNRALDRETTKIKGRDPDTRKKTRQDALATHDTSLMLDEHGTGQLMIGCTATQGAAIADRIDTAARAARHAGDPRTLTQLRTATALALLLHGTADITDLPEDPDLVTVEHTAQLTKILHALPTLSLIHI